MHLPTIHRNPINLVAKVQPRQHSDQQSQDQSHRDQAEDAIILELERYGDDEQRKESPLMRLAYGPATRERLTRSTATRNATSSPDNPLRVLSVYGRSRTAVTAGSTIDRYS